MRIPGQLLIACSVCFMLYLLVFLRLRGYFIVKGWRVRFKFRTGHRTPDFCGDDLPNTKLHNFAKRMLLYVQSP